MMNIYCKSLFYHFVSSDFRDGLNYLNAALGPAPL